MKNKKILAIGLLSIFLILILFVITKNKQSIPRTQKPQSGWTIFKVNIPDTVEFTESDSGFQISLKMQSAKDRKIIRAHLTSPDFAVLSFPPQEIKVTEIKPVTLDWIVKPTKSGNNKISLVVMEDLVEIEKYEKQVHVRASTFDEIYYLLKYNWLGACALLVAVLTLLVSIRSGTVKKSQFVKKKSTKEKW